MDGHHTHGNGDGSSVPLLVLLGIVGAGAIASPVIIGTMIAIVHAIIIIIVSATGLSVAIAATVIGYKIHRHYRPPVNRRPWRPDLEPYRQRSLRSSQRRAIEPNRYPTAEEIADALYERHQWELDQNERG